MLRRSLQTKGVFACHCEVEPDLIVAGIFATIRPGEIVTLTDRDDPEYSVTVEVPPLPPKPTYKVELRIIHGDPEPG
jgi:hypothetical protein